MRSVFGIGLGRTLLEQHRIEKECATMQRSQVSRLRHESHASRINLTISRPIVSKLTARLGSLAYLPYSDKFS